MNPDCAIVMTVLGRSSDTGTAPVTRISTHVDVRRSVVEQRTMNHTEVDVIDEIDLLQALRVETSVKVDNGVTRIERVERTGG